MNATSTIYSQIKLVSLPTKGSGCGGASKRFQVQKTEGQEVKSSAAIATIMPFRTEDIIAEAENFQPGCSINWTKLARKYDVPGANGGGGGGGKSLRTF